MHCNALHSTVSVEEEYVHGCILLGNAATNYRSLHFTSIFEEQLTERNWTIYQYISLNNCLLKKFLESRLVVNTSSWRLGLRVYEWVLRSGKIQRRTCWSFDKTAANKPYFENGTRYDNSYNGSQIKLVRDLSNGAMSNDLEWPVTKISRSRYFQRQITRKWYKIKLYLQ